MKEKPITIAHRKIGPGFPVFIIAELSCNHMQDFQVAVKTLKAIKASGADAVKLQTYTPDTITIDAPQKFFRIYQGAHWDGMALYDLYKKTYTPWDWQPKLKKIADDLGLICFSSPFDKTAVDFLEKMDMPAYKIASFEITDIPLIEYAASKNKPMIISTGVGRLSDIKEAVTACKMMGNDKIALLKCTSAYPAPINELNLMIIPDMIKRFATIVGLSDHTLGITASIAAVALGAKIIEKHFILSRRLKSMDAPFSLEPREFKILVETLRETESALGEMNYRLTKKAQKSRLFTRSLFVVEDINKGERFSEGNIRSIRPASGLAPKYSEIILGKKAKRNIKKGTPLTWGMIKSGG